MVFIQKILPPANKTYLSRKVGNDQIGFKAGDKVNVFAKGDILLFTKADFFLDYMHLKDAKVFKCQNSGGSGQVQLSQPWLRSYASDCTHLRVFYTKIGVFMRPFHGEVNDYVL